MGDGGAILIAAASGRALATSARRAGYVPLVADYFADQDMVAIAGAHVRLNNGLTRGMTGEELLPALEQLARTHEPCGIVCGTGFEDRPELLATISQKWKLYGNNPSVIARVKDPIAFESLCRDCDIPHPAISVEEPANPDGWLRKRRGGAGGVHIGVPGARESASRGAYFQRRVPGRAISALFAADGARALILGFSEQWASPTAKAPFRYGGAARPAEIVPAVRDALAQAIHRLTASVPLVGLNSADFVVDGESFWLLEVNPRPGATLDIFEEAERPLFALHVAACEGALPTDRRDASGCAASAIVYAERDIASFPTLPWPDWATDRPHPGAPIGAGEPLCSVHATAASAAEARRVVHGRVESILAAASARLA